MVDCVCCYGSVDNRICSKLSVSLRMALFAIIHSFSRVFTTQDGWHYTRTQCHTHYVTGKSRVRHSGESVEAEGDANQSMLVTHCLNGICIALAPVFVAPPLRTYCLIGSESGLSEVYLTRFALNFTESATDTCLSTLASRYYKSDNFNRLSQTSDR